MRKPKSVEKSSKMSHFVTISKIKKCFLKEIGYLKQFVIKKSEKITKIEKLLTKRHLSILRNFASKIDFESFEPFDCYWCHVVLLKVHQYHSQDLNLKLEIEICRLVLSLFVIALSICVQNCSELHKGLHS